MLFDSDMSKYILHGEGKYACHVRKISQILACSYFPIDHSEIIDRITFSRRIYLCFSRGQYSLSHLNAHVIKMNLLFAKTERTNEKKRKENKKRKKERNEGWMDKIIFLMRTYRPNRIY